MRHVRTQIRDAVVAALMGLATTGSRVHKSRVYPRDTSQLPCLLVLAGDEDIDHSFQAALDRDLVVVVRCAAKDSAELDDVLDVMLAEVEVAMQAAGTLGGLAAEVSPPVSVSTQYAEGLEMPVGILDVRFQIQYVTAVGVPDAAL
jgi:hypothetical protein